MPHEITDHSLVTLHFSLTLADGTEAISTFDEEPLTFTLGDDTMTKALEQQLIGMHQGSEEHLILSGDEVFGPATADKIQRMPLSDFPPDMPLSPGQIIAFSTPAGDEVGGVILELDQAEALVDFNHPLSGQSITFRVKVLEVGPSELSNGTGD
jgi:FKBP-type peptidyl-prolyl cis-trans isomerase SlpA